MAAAPPTPPPHRVPFTASANAYRHSVVPAGRSPGYEAGDFRETAKSHDVPGRLNPLLTALKAKADQQVNPHLTLDGLLDRATSAMQQANAYLNFGRPDDAFVEYLVAITIVSNVVPRHKDHLMLASRQGLRQKYNELTRRLNAEQNRYDEVKEKLSRNDTHNDTPLNRDPAYSNPQGGSQSNLHDQRPMSVFAGPRPDSPQDPSGFGPKQTKYIPYSQGIETSSAVTKSRPPVRPKPHDLQSYTATGQGGKLGTIPGDALAERFSQLRTNGNQSRLAQQQLPWPSPSNYETRPTDDSLSYQSERSSTPTISTQGSSNLSSNDTFTSRNSKATKTPIKSATSVIPSIPNDVLKPPSPAYSPVRDSYTPAPLPQPRMSAGSMSGSYIAYSHPEKSSKDVSTVDGKPPDRHSLDSRPGASRQVLAPPHRRQSANMPQETEISAQQLYDYLKIFDVLVIDVRSREEFDNGHIFTQHIVCIEPAQLREGMSADELQDSLVLSPQLEQEVFERRAEYDLVVFYDESTKSTKFLQNLRNSANSVALRYLHDALYEFNQEKPLQWPPILLVGGVNAWIDLVGPQALKTEDTAGFIRAQAGKPQRPGQLNSVKRHPSILTVQKKRRRDYNPLDPEEEKAWRERARSESVTLDQKSLDVDQTYRMEGEEEADYLRNYDDFYQRFPDVASMERQSMVVSPPQRPPPPPPLHVAYPAVSPVPSAPTRPAPAVPRQSFGGVSERISPQTGAFERAAQLPPYIPLQFQMRNLRPPRTGLYNFGVTCYMNATIQCLSATLQLSTFFLSGAYKSRLQKDNWKGSKGLMPVLYDTLLSNLWKGDVDTIRPTNFRKFCARLNSEWGVDRQQDAKEFLEFLVDYLHEDLNINWSRTPLKELTPAEEAIRENTPPFVAAKKEWARYCHRDQSYLTELFGGQHKSRLQCSTCRHSSTTYEPFTSISVEIPTARNSGQSISIYDCLRSYSSTEKLSGSEVWNCPTCKRPREATKCITITRAPEFLIVHFKRFSASRSEKAKKVHTEINFPLHGLDLEPFMLPPPDERLAEHIAKLYGAGELDSDASMSPPYKYDAYAVLRHIGATLSSGHYIALVKDPIRKCWRRFDDDRVVDFSPENLPRSKGLDSSEAYIVFYQRIKA